MLQLWLSRHFLGHMQCLKYSGFITVFYRKHARGCSIGPLDGSFLWERNITLSSLDTWNKLNVLLHEVTLPKPPGKLFGHFFNFKMVNCSNYSFKTYQVCEFHLVVLVLELSIYSQSTSSSISSSLRCSHWTLHPFHANFPFLYPMKTSENLRFLGFFG